MIKPEMVPLDVVLALAHRLDVVGTAWEWREHIAAALNAWPEMEYRSTFGPSRIILPLPPPPAGETNE